MTDKKVKPAKKVNDSQKDVDEAIRWGGSFFWSGVKIFVHTGRNTGIRTGYWIRNSMGYTVYFNTADRRKAQEACNDVFGKGMYTVNTPK